MESTKCTSTRNSITWLWVGLVLLVVPCRGAEIPKISVGSGNEFAPGDYYPSQQTPNDVWNYVLGEFSSSKQHLTSGEVDSLLNNLKRCDERSTDNCIFHDPKVPGGCKTSHSPCLWEWESMSFNNLTTFLEMCPRLLYLAVNPKCCDPPFPASLMEDASEAKRKDKPSAAEVWGYGFLFVSLISACSLAGVSVIPFMKKEFYKQMLTCLVGLAVGSLTGSALFHLLPQALSLADNDPEHNYLFTMLVVCGGLWMFFMVERILKFVVAHKDRKDKHWKREKMSSILSSTPENSTISMLVDQPNGKNGPSSNTSGVIYECQEQAIKASFGHQERPRLSSCNDHAVTFEQGKDSVIATVAWMIIFGDGLHNFIDGLSIGAAFNQSILTGVSISVAVLCEELPHELGDFAVLLNAGMSMRQALTYNFLSACTCYIGMAVGILLGGVEASGHIFALASGMFLYISLTDMLPQMNEIAEDSSKISLKKGLKVLWLQNVGFFIGITALFVLAKYQDNIQF